MTAYLTVNRLFNSALEGEKPSIIDDSQPNGGVTVSQSEFRHLINVTSHLLTQILNSECRESVGSQQPSIAVVLPNCIDAVVTFVSICAMGAVNCLLNSKLTVAEMTFAADDLSVCAFLTSEVAFKEMTKSERETLIASLTAMKVPLVTTKYTADSVEVCLWDCQKDCEVYRLKSTDIPKGELVDFLNKQDNCGELTALKLHTSGTTGKPKTVPLTHANIVTTCLNQRNTYMWDDSHKGLLVMPLFHVHGLFNGCIGPLSVGGSIIIPESRSFSKTKFWGAYFKHRPNTITAVPSMYQILVNDEANLAAAKQKWLTENGDAPMFRYCRGCSSAMAPALASAVETHFNTVVLEAYAMTEATHQMCSNTRALRTFGTVGTPQGIDACIVNDSGVIQEIGGIGEICVRGVNVIQNYEGLDDETNANNFFQMTPEIAESASQNPNIAFATTAPPTLRPFVAPLSPQVETSMSPESGSEWFKKHLECYMAPFELRFGPTTSPFGTERLFLRTGDLGIMTPEGQISIVGRSKEMINRGGEKISPLELDAKALECDVVREAASFGIPDDILGERVGMAVVFTDGKPIEECVKTLWAHLRLYVAPFKIPVIYSFDEMPKGPTGKVLRRNINDACAGKTAYKP